MTPIFTSRFGMLCLAQLASRSHPVSTEPINGSGIATCLEGAMLRLKPNAPEPDAIAIAALGFIASDPERLGRFLAVTGLGPVTLRSAAQEPGFFARVLDHLAEDEPLLLAFAANEGLRPESVAAARHALAGPAGM